MKNLKVPYKSQWDADAGKTANDCGPASIAMLLNYYGETLTTNEVFDRTGAGKGLIDIAQMEKAIRSFGYQTERFTRSTSEKLKSFIDRDMPVIALVKYGSLNSVQDKVFKGGHFFLVVGYRDDGYFVNDPNFKGSLRSDGDHHFFTKAEFEKAWADAAKDGNAPNSFQVIHRKESMSKPGKDPLQECLAQHKQLVDAAIQKDAEIEENKLKIKELKKSLEKKSAATVSDFEDKRTKLIEKEYISKVDETADDILSKLTSSISGYKGEVTKKIEEIKTLTKEIFNLRQQKQKDPAGEGTKQVTRVFITQVVGALVAFLYSQFPFLGEMGIEQAVVVTQLVSFTLIGLDKAKHVEGKNTDNQQLIKGLLRF